MTGVPQRIGDADRDQAIEALREHHAAGRLDSAEFDDRMELALAARTRQDLEPLFTDLPTDPRANLVPVASAPAAPSDGQTRSRSTRPAPPVAPWVPVLWVFMWIGALGLAVLTAFQWWWVWLLPIVMGPVITGAAALRRGPKPEVKPGSDRPELTDQP